VAHYAHDAELPPEDRGLDCTTHIVFGQPRSLSEAPKTGPRRVDVGDIACNLFDDSGRHRTYPSTRPRSADAMASLVACLGERDYAQLFGRPGSRAGLRSVMQTKFEEHVLDKLRDAHAGHCSELLSRRPRLARQPKEPVYARLRTTHALPLGIFRASDTDDSSVRRHDSLLTPRVLPPGQLKARGKADGRRILAYKDGPRVRLVSRTGVDHSEPFHGVAQAVAALPFDTLVLDGEVAIFDQQLRSRLDWLREPGPAAVATPPLSGLASPLPLGIAFWLSLPTTR
jgi:ATP dependent DNA ligase domain